MSKLPPWAVLICNGIVMARLVRLQRERLAKLGWAREFTARFT